MMCQSHNLPRKDCNRVGHCDVSHKDCNRVNQYDLSHNLPRKDCNIVNQHDVITISLERTAIELINMM